MTWADHLNPAIGTRIYVKELAAEVRSLQTRLKEAVKRIENERDASCPECPHVEETRRAEREASELRAKLSAAKAEGRRDSISDVLEAWQNMESFEFEKWIRDEAKGGA